MLLKLTNNKKSFRKSREKLIKKLDQVPYVKKTKSILLDIPAPQCSKKRVIEKPFGGVKKWIVHTIEDFYFQHKIFDSKKNFYLNQEN